MALHYLNTRKIEEKLLLYFTVQQKGKGMEYTKHRKHLSLSLLFAFSLDKWTLFYTIKDLQHYFNTDFRIVSFLIKIFISDYFCQYREV